MEIRQAIEQKLTQTLTLLGVESASTVLEHPGELSHGDYATGIALKYAKELGKNPRALAEEITVSLGTIEGVTRIDIAGPGFINFTLTPQAVASSLEKARATDMWGSSQLRADKKIMVEYTDPNPFKEFHIGHRMAIGSLNFLEHR
jgi:arginyl-tRNA synthetase